MKQINLLPKIEQRELKLAFLAKRLWVFWIWILGSMTILFLLALATRFYLNNIINDTQNLIEQNKALLDSSDYRDLQNQIVLLNRNIKEIKNLESQHYLWSDALVELANIIPNDMQLNQITFDQGTGMIVVTGQAKIRESVIQLWSNVIKSEYFSKINFPLTNLEEANNPSFTYTFYVNKEKFKSE